LTLRTGVLELVQALPAVLERWPGARLAIAGDGHQRATIKEYIHRSGLDDRAVLLGRLDDAELRNWYRAADLTVTPSQELEGFGLSTAESLAVGTPALVTPVGANPEVVRDLHPLLVASGCGSADLAAGICRVLGEQGLLHTLRSTARAQVHPQWSWAGVAGRYLELYQAIGT
jgi:glycosyltransferase involved in cell wall biosynthesis